MGERSTTVRIDNSVYERLLDLRNRNQRSITSVIEKLIDNWEAMEATNEGKR